MEIFPVVDLRTKREAEAVDMIEDGNYFKLQIQTVTNTFFSGFFDSRSRHLHQLTVEWM